MMTRVAVAGDAHPVEEQLVEAAICLLGQYPPSSINGRQLADEAGLNYGLIHRHFGTKSAVFVEAFERIANAFVADAFGDDARPHGLPRPRVLPEHPAYWRAATLLVLDQRGYSEYHDRSRVISRYVAGLRAARTELSDRESATLAALACSLELGDVLFRPSIEHALQIDRAEARIDELLTAWIIGLHTGRGPLGAAPTTPRTLRRPPPATPPRPAASRSSAPAELVEAGARLLVDRSPTAISGRELARAAGVNYGLIHHYFGTKDEVLRQSLQWQRDEFHVATNADDRPADYFAVRSHPGFARALAWAALDGSLARDGTHPTVVAIAEIVDRRGGDLDHRIALYASIVTQLAWQLYETSLSTGTQFDIVDLEPYAATALHRLVTEPTAGLDTIAL